MNANQNNSRLLNSLGAKSPRSDAILLAMKPVVSIDKIKLVSWSWLAFRAIAMQVIDEMLFLCVYVYVYVYVDKAMSTGCGTTCVARCNKRKRYSVGQDHRRHIPNRRPISERSAHDEDRKQVCAWKLAL